MPIDVKAQHIDFLSTGGHKWLMGVEGTACTHQKKRLPSLGIIWQAGFPSRRLSFLFEGAGLLDTTAPSRCSFLEGGVANTIGFSLWMPLSNILLDRIEKFEHIQKHSSLEEELLIWVSISSRTGAESSILSLFLKGYTVMNLYHNTHKEVTQSRWTLRTHRTGVTTIESMNRSLRSPRVSS